MNKGHRTITLCFVASLGFLSACQQLSPNENLYNPDSDFKTTASTSDKADLGNRVWLDTNGDGIKQTPENGFRGITVDLWTDRNNDGTPEDKLATQVTDAGGFYRFNALDPNINYILKVEAPDGFAFSLKDSPSSSTEDRDSDINNNGLSDSITVEAGKYNYFVDAALKVDGGTPPAPIKLSRLGDRIWNDLNGDGLKQGNEPGFKDIKVNLWIDSNKDGTPDVILKTDMTDGGGYYFFNALDSVQQYFLQVELPEGYTASPKNNPATSSNDKDSDLNQNGTSDALNLKPLIYTYWIDGGLTASNTFKGLQEKAVIDLGTTENADRVCKVDLAGDQVAIVFAISDSGCLDSANVIIYSRIDGSWQEASSVAARLIEGLPNNIQSLKISDIAISNKQLVIAVEFSTPEGFKSEVFVLREENNQWLKEQSIFAAGVEIFEIINEGDEVFVVTSGEINYYKKVDNSFGQPTKIQGRFTMVKSGDRFVAFSSNEIGSDFTAIFEKSNGDWRQVQQISEEGLYALDDDSLVIKSGRQANIYQFDGQVWQVVQSLTLATRTGYPQLSNGKLFFTSELEVDIYEKEQGFWVLSQRLGRGFKPPNLSSEFILRSDADLGRLAIARDGGRFDTVVIYE